MSEDMSEKVAENDWIDDDNTYKPVYFFGQDVRKVKCFRNSIFCGIYCAVGGGLGCFMWTSKAMFSVYMAYASYCLGVFAYWIPCRYKHETSLIVGEALKANIKESIERKKARENEKSS